MGTTQSTEAEDDGEEKEKMAGELEFMHDAPEVLRVSESGYAADGAGGGYTAAQQIDIAAPMDIGTPRRGAAEHVDNSMPDSSFASSFGSFMSPPEGGAGAPDLI